MYRQLAFIKSNYYMIELVDGWVDLKVKYPSSSLMRAAVSGKDCKKVVEV